MLRKIINNLLKKALYWPNKTKYIHTHTQKRALILSVHECRGEKVGDTNLIEDNIHAEKLSIIS